MLSVDYKISRTRARQKAKAWLWEFPIKPELRFATVVVWSTVDSKIFSFEFFYSEVAQKWLIMN